MDQKAEFKFEIFPNPVNGILNVNISDFTSPLKLFEYMSHKKPIIASDLPVIREVLDEKNSILVNNSLDYQTNIPGVFAIGDINTYPGKLNLILCGFHEAALMCQAAFKIMNPEKKFILKYTTVSGVEGFDGTMKKAEGSVVKSIK